MLTKNQIAQKVEAETNIPAREVKDVMDVLGEIALEEVKGGQDFSIPGLVRISYRYRAKLKKGEGTKRAIPTPASAE